MVGNVQQAEIDSVMQGCIAQAAMREYGDWYVKFAPRTLDEWQAFLRRVRRAANDPGRRTLHRIWLRAVELRLRGER